MLEKLARTGEKPEVSLLPGSLRALISYEFSALRGPSSELSSPDIESDEIA